ncbi:hypothetical protein DL96DRAFT_1825327 [Flagelloscypha sp. PMI_526]|nr:hypothetical protein DL96DRAFT_1825327 [Flagelloscypha sp. PMI_526]
MALRLSFSSDPSFPRSGDRAILATTDSAQPDLTAKTLAYMQNGSHFSAEDRYLSYLKHLIAIIEEAPTRQAKVFVPRYSYPDTSWLQTLIAVSSTPQTKTVSATLKEQADVTPPARTSSMRRAKEQRANSVESIPMPPLPGTKNSSSSPSSYSHTPTAFLSQTLVLQQNWTCPVHGTTHPMFVDPHGPLAKAAQFSGLSAVEELGLLKAQVEHVSCVCKAVALGDLSQKITVQVKGEVMAQLKDVINSIIDNLSHFADEVTRVSFEVGMEGKLGSQAHVADMQGRWNELMNVVHTRHELD